jgi:hypothetical protein
MGAASAAGVGAAAGAAAGAAPASTPQAGSQVLQPPLQGEPQPQARGQHLRAPKMRSIKPGPQQDLRIPQDFLPQGDSQPQLGSAGALQAAGASQVGSALQAVGAAQVGSEQAGLQQRGRFKIAFRLLIKFGPQHFFLQQGVPQLGAEQGSAPQAGSAAAAALQQPLGAAALQLLGAAALQQLVGAAGAALQQPLGAASAALQQPLGAALLQDFTSQQLVVQPQPLAPSILSSRSKPKLWLQRLMPSIIDPKIMFHFIEPLSMFEETVR